MKLNEYSRTILFDSGKASLKTNLPTLGSITEFKRISFFKILVEGQIVMEVMK
jgi:hypothetical protein